MNDRELPREQRCHPAQHATRGAIGQLAESLEPWTPDVLYPAASAYVEAGLSIIPIKADASKQPVWSALPVVPAAASGRPKHSWRVFQQRRPTADELRAWFTGWGTLRGIAVIGGGVSGSLEIIDLDSMAVAQPWVAAVEQLDPALLEKLVLVQTPRPGLHVYYRCPTIERNQKLAQRLEANAETGVPEVKTLIETRGEGGYVLVPPSSPQCHPTRRTYQYVGPRDLTNIPTITVDERDLLLRAARQFHDIPEPARIAPPPRTLRLTTTDRSLPGNDFNARADWSELLMRNGWSFVCADPDGKQHWRRPGKSEGTSATINFAGHDLLHVFSSNAAPLEPDKSYSKFAFVAHVEHGSDFSAASRALRAQGFGPPELMAGRRPRSSRRPNRGGDRGQRRRR